MFQLRSLLAPALVAALSPPAPGQVTHYEFSSKLPPTASPSGFGGAVAGAGDVDADGFDDLLVKGEDVAGTKLVYVYSGRDGSVILTLSGDANSVVLGRTLDGAGDLDADGHADLIVGDENDRTYAWITGKVWVYSGRTGAVMFTFNHTWWKFGSAVSAAGDVDADGHDDVLIGVRNSRRVEVRSGRDGSILRVLTAPFPYNGFGQAVSEAGDLDGDGFDDLMVGAPESFFNGALSGSVLVFSGRNGTILRRFHGPAAMKRWGRHLAGGRDIDADGVPDVVIGTPDADLMLPNEPGSAHVFSGADGSLLHVLVGQAPLDGFGAGVATLGDVDGDGRCDLAVAAPSQGKGYVYSGADGSLLHELEPPGGLTVVEHAGDVNGDGLADLIHDTLVSVRPLSREARVLSSFQYDPPTPYCSGKLDSNGCLPGVRYEGVPALFTGGLPMHVIADEVASEVDGLLFWGTAALAKPFLGGTLCVAPPRQRTPVQFSGGSYQQMDCTGSLRFVFDPPYAAGQGLGPGHEVYAQFWYRDLAHPDGTETGLSDAIRFTLTQ